jgi:hypothetical protein
MTYNIRKISAEMAEVIRTLLHVLVDSTATIHCTHRPLVYVATRDDNRQCSLKLCLLYLEDTTIFSSFAVIVHHGVLLRK